MAMQCTIWFPIASDALNLDWRMPCTIDVHLLTADINSVSVVSSARDLVLTDSTYALAAVGRCRNDIVPGVHLQYSLHCCNTVLYDICELF